MIPSSAVTTIDIELAPTLKLIGPNASPLTTVSPFTLIVAVPSAAVGVTVVVLIELATVTA
ncbi:hypothetical protein ES703_84689 [subsurface metagenome]